MGRYVPPEHEGTISANKLAGKHALGARANKIKDGILTVRFEMPFAIWCDHCPPETIIGQGVRFNAEKKKVGNYHSTPIYSFRMRHPACDGWIEIRTDPQNTEYVVTEGARKRDYGEWKEDRDQNGNLRILTEEEREKRRSDAFATLEGKVQDKVQAKTDADRISELKAHQKKSWEDPYTQNQKLRALFRPGRKLRQKKEAETEQLRDRSGLGIELLEETEEDAKRASFVDFGHFVDGEEHVNEALRRPLFDDIRSQSLAKSGPGKAGKGKPNASALLATSLRDNTRAIMDPFLVEKNGSSFTPSTGNPIPGLKRRKNSSDDKPVAKKLASASNGGDSNEVNTGKNTKTTNNEVNETTVERQALTLVHYDSDDD